MNILEMEVFLGTDRKWKKTGIFMPSCYDVND